MVDLVCDICRAVNIVLIVVILFLLQRAVHVKGENWTEKMHGLHRFMTVMMIGALFGFIEKISANSEPAFTPFIFTVILIYGITRILKKGGYVHEEVGEHE